MNVIRSAAILTALTLAGAGAALAQAAARTPPPRAPHATEGRDCLSCHAQGANEHVKSVPANHRYQNAMCARCHRPAETMPPSPQHALDAQHARCAACHVAGNTAGARPMPASHGGRHASTCSMCHQQRAGGG